MTSKPPNRRRGRRADMPVPTKPAAGGSEGGKLAVLSDADMAMIDAAAKTILWQTGITDTPEYLAKKPVQPGRLLAPKIACICQKR